MTTSATQSRTENTTTTTDTGLAEVARIVAAAHLTPPERARVLEAMEAARHTARRTSGTAAAAQVLDLARDPRTPAKVSAALHSVAPTLVRSSRR